ncbi:MAG TPA: glycosyl hydrolase family 57 [Phycisphaerae bacterium]|nr:glycosyl hydrolase family 57 [Phycisphaerae bacterium]
MTTVPTTAGLDSIVDGLPNICGHWNAIEEAALAADPVFLDDTDIDPSDVQSAFALALHMHQPTIPAGGDDLQTAALIGNLQWMVEHPDVHDSHNAGPFAWCYERMAELVPRLVAQGKSPRIMLDYSGNLLWGLEQMGRQDILNKLVGVSCDPKYRRHVEWLGTMWGHAVVSSTPPADIALHIRAWQEHFAAIFGTEALARVRGFSPPEMHLPNDPDIVYLYVQALLDAGYTWLLVQEHTVENPDGSGLRQPHLPHRLVVRNSDGDTVSITALVKTQGSDNKLVAQMQPLGEARTLNRQELGGVAIPPLVTQIGDGENGGVMMNEFPQAYLGRMAELDNRGVVALNGTEYLELVEAAGVKPQDFIPIQPIFQHAIWSRVEGAGRQAVDRAVEAAKAEVPDFHLDGGSWTNNISWEQGYENVVNPMDQLSAKFHQTLDGKDVDPSSPQYRSALLHLLISQTSCFRYWGQGRWTDYAREICRRGADILQNNF